VAIKVRKVADIVDNIVETCGRDALLAAAILTNQQPIDDLTPQPAWQMALNIGEGAGARRVVIDLPLLLNKGQLVDAPVFIGKDQLSRSLFYYRARLFLSDRSPRTEAERAEISLRIEAAGLGQRWRRLCPMRRQARTAFRSHHSACKGWWKYRGEHPNPLSDLQSEKIGQDRRVMIDHVVFWITDSR
jgi:hypothetical protein